MANFRTIQLKLDIGRGKAALKLGQPYNVFRVGGRPNPGSIAEGINAATNYLDPLNQIGTNVPVFRRAWPAKQYVETSDRMSVLFFEIVGNMDPWALGDVFVLSDKVFYATGDTSVDFATKQINAFCLMAHSPVKKSIGARLDRLIQIYRPVQSPDASGYWHSTLGLNVAPVILNLAQFGLGTGIAQSLGAFGALPYQLGGTTGDKAALIPAGFQPIPQIKNGHYASIPGDTGTQHWSCYIPPLPDGLVSGGSAQSSSFPIREGDIILDYDGARYIVKHPFRQEVGHVGNFLIIERETSA